MGLEGEGVPWGEGGAWGRRGAWGRGDIIYQQEGNIYDALMELVGGREVWLGLEVCDGRGRSCPALWEGERRGGEGKDCSGRGRKGWGNHRWDGGVTGVVK